MRIHLLNNPLTKRTPLFGSVLAMTILVSSVTAAVPLGTGFTYQGRLHFQGKPYTGAAHFRFSLWDSPGTGSPPTGGNQIGSTQLASNVNSVSGTFTVLLNNNGEFGPDAFNGEARWLQIQYCTDAICTTVTTLSPRQPITGAPYALGPWNSVNNGVSFMTGSVGIGAANPTSKLEIAAQDGLTITGLQPFLTLRDTNAANARSQIRSIGGSIYIFTDNYLNGTLPTAFARFTNNGYLGIGTNIPQGPLEVRSAQNSFIRMDNVNGDLHYNGGNDGYFGLYNDGVVNGRTEIISQGAVQMAVTNTGNMGIGTSAPAGSLDVRGDIRSGSSGQYFAPAGEENLRILRGTVGFDGTIRQGSGFTATRTTTGRYSIVLDTPYPSPPSVVALTYGLYNNVTMAGVASTDFVILVTRDGSGEDSAFSFIAAGPR